MFQKILKVAIALVGGSIIGAAVFFFALVVYVASGEFFLKHHINTPDPSLLTIKLIFFVLVVVFSVMTYWAENRVLRQYRNYNPA